MEPQINFEKRATTALESTQSLYCDKSLPFLPRFHPRRVVVARIGNPTTLDTSDGGF